MDIFKPKKMVSIIVMVSLFFTLVFLANSAQASAVVVDPLDPGTKDEGDPVDQEDFDILETYGDLLTEEQTAVLEAAFAQMKESITSAESVYQDAIKVLKDKYRDTVQDAVKSIEDEGKLVSVIDQLKADILAEYESIQRTLDTDVSVARETFVKTADAASIPTEIIDSVAAWHATKELNAANELTNFIESFRSGSGNAGNSQGEGQGLGSNGENAGQQNVNSEKNQDKNQNQTEQENKEQNQHQEKNEEGIQSQQQEQPGNSAQGGKGKGK